MIDGGTGSSDPTAAARELRAQFEDLPIVLLTPLLRLEGAALDFVTREVAITVAKPVKRGRLWAALTWAVEREARPRPSTSSPPDAGPATVLRVLVADDNQVNQVVERKLVEKLGHRVDVVADGLEAISAVDRAVYDVVLLDVQMPTLNGLEAARRLCDQWPAGVRPRLIAVTANASTEDRAECMAAGMDDYLTKPVRLRDLESALLRATPNPRHVGP